MNSSKLDNATLSVLQDVNSSLAMSVIYGIVTIINLIGNGLSLWLLVFRTSPKTPSIIFMINLTITDLAIGIALPFQIAYQLLGYHWVLGPSMCRYCLLAGQDIPNDLDEIDIILSQTLYLHLVCQLFLQTFHH